MPRSRPLGAMLLALAAASGVHGQTNDEAARSKPSAGAQSRTRKIVVQGGALNGKAVYKPEPDYPPAAKAARAQGMVVVRILVDEKGNVVSARAISGHGLLKRAAVTAATHTHLSPESLSGLHHHTYSRERDNLRL